MSDLPDDADRDCFLDLFDSTVARHRWQLFACERDSVRRIHARQPPQRERRRRAVRVREDDHRRPVRSQLVERDWIPVDPLERERGRITGHASSLCDGHQGGFRQVHKEP